MMDEDARLTQPTPAQAAQALAQLDSARAMVEEEAARCRPDRPLTLTTMAAYTVLTYSWKDLAPARVRTAGVALSWFAALGYASWAAYRTRVTALDPDEALEAARTRQRWETQLAHAVERKQAGQPPEQGAFAIDQRTRERWTATGRALALAGAVTIGERLVVAGLRRSSLHYPNVVAGLVLAATRTTIGGLQLQTRLLGTAANRTIHKPADDPENEPLSDELHKLLFDPTQLTIVGLLAASARAEITFVRDATGLTDSALSEQLHTLSQHQLVELETTRPGPRRRTWIRLTLRGHETVASHAAALTTIVQRAPRKQ